MTRLSPSRAAGKTTEASQWNRAQRRAFTRAIATEGERRMRQTRTAIRHAKRKRG